jgi:hypothetical protein
MSIPARVHFCWIGPPLSWAYAFALLSAAAQAGMDEVVLHHTDELEEGAVLTALRSTPGMRLERIDARDLLAEAGARLGLSGVLADIDANLASPAQRSDVLRAAILYLQGGIYLDLDTITVASLRPLLDAPQFIGTEYIVWPHWVRSSRSWKVWAKHLALDVLRSGLRLCPGGWRGFRHVEHWYFKGINGAVMGGPAGAPLFAANLMAMAALPPARRSQPYALGPDLLQSLVGQFSGVELVIHEPAVFYPLAPEISTHWFRSGVANLDLALRPQTRVVHWYASVRSKPYVALIDPNHVRAHRHTQLYSALVSRVLPQHGANTHEPACSAVAASEMPREIQGQGLDPVEGLGPCTLKIRGEHVIARQVIPVATVQVEVPVPPDIAPLHAESGVERGCRGDGAVARGAQEQPDRQRIVEAVAPVEGAEADQE